MPYIHPARNSGSKRKKKILSVYDVFSVTFESVFAYYLRNETDSICTLRIDAERILHHRTHAHLYADAYTL